jgi:hypothetical protein
MANQRSGDVRNGPGWHVKMKYLRTSGLFRAGRIDLLSIVRPPVWGPFLNNFVCGSATDGVATYYLLNWAAFSVGSAVAQKYLAGILRGLVFTAPRLLPSHVR